MLSAPERSVEQRREALAKANSTRYARAAWKKDVNAGRVGWLDVLLDPPKDFESMRVYTYLMALPKIGDFKARRLLNVARISTAKTLGGMTDRQRDELAELLTGRPYDG